MIKLGLDPRVHGSKARTAGWEGEVSAKARTSWKSDLSLNPGSTAYMLFDFAQVTSLLCALTLSHAKWGHKPCSLYPGADAETSPGEGLEEVPGCVHPEA